MAGSSNAGTQFKRLRALTGGNVDRVLEGRVSFSSGFLGRLSSSSSPRSSSSMALHQVSWFLSAI